jgi:3-hydroxyisobutyrate dehydrogenase-like beta-hydroxyacid dehydrogenase
VNVGFVGLGDQGLPIALRLAASPRWQTHVWARRPEASSSLRTAGATVHSSLAALAEVCDVVGVCVTDDEAVVAVVEELLTDLAPGAVVLVHSTVLPATCESLAARAALAGVGLLDAPVSGGADAAAAGRLQVLVGGPADAVERVRPVLEAFAATITPLGDVGAAQAVKVVNNTLMMVNGAAAFDALDLIVAAGGDRAAASSAIGGASGASYALARLGKFTSPGFVDHAIRLLSKDLGLFEAMTGDEGKDLATSAHRFLDRLASVSSVAGARPLR